MKAEIQKLTYGQMKRFDRFEASLRDHAHEKAEWFSKLKASLDEAYYDLHRDTLHHLDGVSLTTGQVIYHLHSICNVVINDIQIS